MVLACWAERRFELVTSEHILNELERTLAKNYFRRGIPAESVPDKLARFRDGATVTAITANIRNVASHPEDNVVLATAVSEGAQFLVTSDKQLLKLQEHQETRIVDAAGFLLILFGK